MNKRVVALLIMALFITSSFVLITSPADEISFWNENWSFREEIIIPIDTKDDSAKYQPIDINVNFNKSCWAINEVEHSVRLIFQNDEKFLELELQIYDLNYTDKEHIDSCNLVFLIPNEANGNEKYYVYYDDEKKPSPNYQKRVNVEESYYRYEPIQGLSFESSFYKITEEEDIIYGINKEGKIMGDQASQQATKLKKGAKDIKPSNIENTASFNLVYWVFKDGKWHEISNSADKLISSQIFVNGNLMVKVGITTQSNDGFFQTTTIYKYYYCPTENKRLYTHVKEEIIKYPIPTGSEIDVTYVTIYCGGIKSSILKELNFGDIPPYFHFYSDDERVLTQKFDQYPDYANWQLLIKKQDDYDLGSSPWVSVDYGENGRAHGIIFESNKVLKSGTDEVDGIEIQLCESKNIQYPGLDGRVADLYLMRNDYEKNEPLDTLLPKNYVIEFNAEYYTTEDGGYPAVEKEAGIYQKLISYQPKNQNNVTGGNIQEKERHSLITYVHLAPSVPLGSLLSAALGENFSYIYAELYKDDYFRSSGSINRISLGNIEPDLKDKKLFEKLKTILGFFDWKNASFFKKIKFPDLEPGTYIVKIYKENPMFANERQYIGFGIIDLKKDDSLRIFCRPQGTIALNVLNQENKAVENAKILLKIGNTTIADTSSDKNGSAFLKAPCYGNKPYTLKIIYKGFLVDEENDIRLGQTRRFIPLKKTIEFDVHDLKISFKDSDENAPSFDLNLGLTSDEMYEPIVISPDNIANGTYSFKAIYKGNYDLKIKYNLFDILEKIRIPNINSLTINLYDFNVFVMDNWDLKSEVPLDVSLTSKDFEEAVVICGSRLSNDRYIFSEIYPGEYTLKATYKTYTVEESFDIRNNLEAEIKLPAVFNITTKILDARGNQLKDVKVIMSRGEKEIQGITNSDGNVILSIPPGVYVNRIYNGDELIAERKVSILNEKSYSIVTTNQPILPFIIIGLSTVLLIAALILSYRKKDVIFFLKILAIALMVIAVFSPWWTVYGSTTSPHFETSTNLYFLPVNMVTITSNGSLNAGEIVSLDERFISAINIVTVIIGFSVLSIIATLIADRYKKRKTSLLIFVILLIGLMVSIVLSFYAMSELATATVGGIAGSENLEVNIIGEDMYVKVPCSWGPSIGFYLLLISVIFLVVTFVLNLRKILSYRIKKC